MKESPQFGPYDDEKLRKSRKKRGTKVRHDLAIIQGEATREGDRYTRNSNHEKEKKKKKHKHLQVLQHDEKPEPHVQSAHNEGRSRAPQRILDDGHVINSLRSLAFSIEDTREEEQGVQGKAMMNAYSFSSLYEGSDVSNTATVSKFESAEQAMKQQWISEQGQRMPLAPNFDEWETFTEMDARKPLARGSDSISEEFLTIPPTKISMSDLNNLDFFQRSFAQSEAAPINEVADRRNMRFETDLEATHDNMERQRDINTAKMPSLQTQGAERTKVSYTNAATPRGTASLPYVPGAAPVQRYSATKRSAASIPYSSSTASVPQQQRTIHQQLAIHGASDPTASGTHRDLENDRKAQRNDSGRVHQLQAMHPQNMGTDSRNAHDVAQTFAHNVARFRLEHETESTNGHEYDAVGHGNRTSILDYYRLVNDTKAGLELNRYDRHRLGAYANPPRRAGYGDESTSMVTVDAIVDGNESTRMVTSDGIGSRDESTSMVTVDGTGERFDEEKSSSLDVSQSSTACVASGTAPVARQARPRFESPGAIEMDEYALGAPVRERCGPGGSDIEEVSLTEEESEKHVFFRRAFIMLVLVIVVVIAIVVLLLFTGKDGSKSEDDSGEDDPPTPAPTFISNALLRALEGVSSSEALSTPGSPQRTAIGWLSSIDESGIEATDDRLIQRYVLVVFYFATSGDQWLDRDNWLDPSQHECQWGSSITCKTDPSNQEIVIGLNLSTHGLKGELPPEIGYLDQTEHFIMSSNWLNGTLPASLFNMTKLAVLDLHGNNFTDSLPSTISNAPFIVYLDLSMNLFGGEIPEALYDLSILRKLDVSVNQITGLLGSGLGKLGNLTILNVRWNLITGVIPDTFDLLPNLAIISLDNNLLTGNIPEFSGVFVQHQEVTVAHNLLTGSIPELTLALGGVYSKSDRLQKVDISKNRLVGTIPSYIGFVPSIRHFDFSHNEFEGTFPTGVDMWLSIEYLAASNCQLTGTAPTVFPPSLSHYDFHGNRLGGGFPVELTGISLEYLSLAYNDLGGQIPPLLGSMKDLEAFDLNACSLTGTIPSLINMTSLARIGLAENSLGGSLSTDIGSLSTLTELNLHSNQLTGSIPTELGELSNLVVFDLAENFLSGTLPSELGNMMNLDRFFVADNNLGGSVPEAICQLVDDLRQVDVGCQLECNCCSDDAGFCT